MSEKNKVNPTGRKNTANLDKLRGIEESEPVVMDMSQSFLKFHNGLDTAVQLASRATNLKLFSFLEGLKLLGQDAN